MSGPDVVLNVAPEAESGSCVTGPAQMGAGERREVMVVDDDEGVRCAVIALLSEQGISAREAIDGLDGLERVRSGPPPCAIVLDVDMPRLSGPALVAALRADPNLPRLPVVTMSAGIEPVGLDTDGHLPKPFAAQSLVAALFKICRSCAACDGGGPVVGSVFVARRAADLAAAARPSST
jgi:CheY-like chemotaxis protein